MTIASAAGGILPRPAAIIWDWDNTLVDGWAAIAAGLNAAFAAFGLPRWSVEDVRARVRRSLRESFPEVFGAEWERARDIFYAEVRARHLRVLSPMPGAAEALRAGAALAVPMALNSNKQGPLLRAEAAHLGWAELFRAAIGAGDAEADKPDPAPMRLALRACGVPPGPAVWYVGDTALDMQAARAASCAAVLVGNAEHDGGVANAMPDSSFPDCHALAAYLLRLAKTPVPAGS